MEKEFVPYELALRMKALGFDEYCCKYVYVGDTGNNVNHYIEVEPSKAENYNKDSLCISQPLFQQAFRWFREKHGLAAQFAYYHVPKWTFEILEFTEIKLTPSKIVVEYSKPRTYEEAEIACLTKLIEIVEQSKSE